MAARRSKSQARRNPSRGLPGWAWLVIGVLVTLLVVLAAPRLLKSGADGDGFLRLGPKPNPDAQPASSVNDDAVAPDVATETPASGKHGDDKPKSPQYDFYTLLPGEEVAMSDAELAASTRAEAAAQAAVRKTAASAAQAGLPPPISEHPDTATAAASAAGASTVPASGSNSGDSNPANPAATSSDARYILQAGAFGGSGDAETVKAKIAMLGLNARVEAAQIGGKTVYRVRMGPYGTASELADAKSKLASGGLPAMAVKTN